MDRCMELVYETEGQHGAEIRGWHGRDAQMRAMQRERNQAEYEQAMREQYDASLAERTP